MATTDFEDWTYMLDLEDCEEVDSLYQSVKTVSDFGLFRTVRGERDGSYLVTASYVDDSLFLNTEEARRAFLKYIENKFCGGEMEEAWYGVQHANAKDD